MNTRLQVEHTVTEMVTGVDLVEMAAPHCNGRGSSTLVTSPRGVTPSSSESTPKIQATGFSLPPGQVVEWQEPAGLGVRVDSWVRPGTSVSRYYDNLMAKLIVWGPNRQVAIDRGRRALEDFKIRGVASTIPAHLAVLDHPTSPQETTTPNEWMDDPS